MAHGSAIDTDITFRTVPLGDIPCRKVDFPRIATQITPVVRYGTFNLAFIGLDIACRTVAFRQQRCITSAMLLRLHSLVFLEDDPKTLEVDVLALQSAPHTRR